MSAPVHIIGASGHCGLALCRSLLADARPFVPVVRSAAKWAGAGLDVPPRHADLADPRALAAALAGAGTVVSCAHASHTQAVLAAAPAGARLVLLGSTRSSPAGRTRTATACAPGRPRSWPRDGPA